jgi:hypothetical protein
MGCLPPSVIATLLLQKQQQKKLWGCYHGTNVSVGSSKA